MELQDRHNTEEIKNTKDDKKDRTKTTGVFSKTLKIKCYC